MIIKTTLAIFLFLLIINVSAYSSAKAPENLTGTWLIDLDESDDPKILLSKSMEMFDPGAVRVVETARGSPVVMGRYIRKPSKKKLDAAFTLLNSVVPLNAISHIDHQDPVLTLTYDDGRVRTVYTDERDSAATVQTTALDRDQRLVFAAWEEGKVVIESNTTSGTFALEHLRVIKDEDQSRTLQVIIEIESTRIAKPLRFSYLYRLSQ